MQRRHLAPLLSTASVAATLTIGAPLAGASQPAVVVGAPTCVPLSTPGPAVHAATTAATFGSRTDTIAVGLPGFESSTGKLLGATVSLVVTTDQTLSTRARQGRWWSENAATSSVTVMVPGAPSLEVRSRQQFGVGTSAPPEALGRNFLLLDAPNPHVGPVEHATTTTTSGAITTDALGQYLTGSVSATVDATSGVRLVTAHAEATSSTSTSTSLCVAYRYLPILSVTAGPPTGAMLVTGISTVGFSGWLLRSRRRSRMHR